MSTTNISRESVQLPSMKLIKSAEIFTWATFLQLGISIISQRNGYELIVQGSFLMILVSVDLKAICEGRSFTVITLDLSGALVPPYISFNLLAAIFSPVSDPPTMAEAEPPPMMGL